ncbi:hypothetical protein SAMN05216228_1021136 [Rhizobium tibeticum]|uniref:Uncharacterized protein n=1 Tax=Rhizobium tibeticum TaxID=501024 RepID=A0A1H8RIV9_9HYPH|nr:hypothetical protein RTCCBAU85039_4149 [Rhizobium tibeticum]SEO66479.1 hypothetical protein SAMN05216228_1021136 [Rhizobium tibeticum]
MAGSAGLQHKVKGVLGRYGGQLRLVLDMRSERSTAHRFTGFHTHALRHRCRILVGRHSERYRIGLEVIRQTVETLVFLDDIGFRLRNRMCSFHREVVDQRLARLVPDKLGCPLELREVYVEGTLNIPAMDLVAAAIAFISACRTATMSSAQTAANATVRKITEPTIVPDFMANLSSARQTNKPRKAPVST